MGFIERIVEAMKPATVPEQVKSGAEKTDDKIQGPQTDEMNTDDKADLPAPAEEAKEKTYSQDEMNAIIEERKKEWETEQIASLSKDGQIEKLKAELLKRDLREKVISRLGEANLPIGVAEFVQYTDEAETMDNLEKVITTVNQLVQEGITLRLRGKTPEGLGMAAQRENKVSDPFAKAFLDAMKN